ncbi:MAG: hemerythrin domain-containing protein, partial [Candidatus Latescibacterota bacterium]
STQISKNERQQQFSRMRDALLPHMYAEENYFYQYLMDHGGKREKLLEAVEEHRAARSVMQDIESTPADDERWMAKLTVLNELLRHHIQEEEGDIFDMAKKAMSDKEAKEMGSRFKEIEQGETTARYV